MKWWEVPAQTALVWRTAAKDCNADEFDQFVAVARELGLNPLRKQIYAFVFNKDEPTKRNMALVIGIDGFRSVAARSGNYQPDTAAVEFVYDERAKNPLVNPLGIVSCTAGVFHRPTPNDPFKRIVATVYWDEFAPIVESADPDAYTWVGTGELHPAGHKKAGQEKMRKQLRPGASAEVTRRLDPRKEQWTKMGRHKIALCAEAQVLRRGWPEDFSRIYAEEEVDKAASILDGVDYQTLTASEMVEQGEAADRLERLGGPALFAVTDQSGTLERIAMGKFADRMLEVTAGMAPGAVAAFVVANKAAFNEFWAHNKNDALALKKELETRSEGGTVRAAPSTAPAKAAPPQHGEPDTGGAAPSSVVDEIEALNLRDELLKEIPQLKTMMDFTLWASDASPYLDKLPQALRKEVETEFSRCQSQVAGK